MNTCKKHRFLLIVATIIVSLLTTAAPAVAAPSQKDDKAPKEDKADKDKADKEKADKEKADKEKADKETKAAKDGAAGAAAGEFELRTDSLPAITQGDTAWVALSWFAGGGDAENVRVTATANKGATVSYPTNTGDHSGPYGETGIAAGGIDFTALRVAVPVSANGNVKLEVRVTWDENGESRSANHKVNLHATKFSGQDLQILTETVTVDPAAGGWVGVEFAGLAPALVDFQLTVTDAAGLALEYPLGGYTSLHANSTLEDGETDVARFYIAPTEATGTVQVQYEISYDGPDGPVTAGGPLAVSLTS